MVEIIVPQLHKVGRVQLTLGRQLTAVQRSGEGDQGPEEDREKAGEEEEDNEDGEDTEGQLEESVQCVRLSVTVVESLRQMMFPRYLEVRRPMRAVRLVGPETLRTLGGELAAFVVKPAVSLETLQDGLGREVPGWGRAVLGLTDGTPPGPAGPTEPRVTLATHGVSGPAHQHRGTPGEDQTHGTLQLLLYVDFHQQQPAQLPTPRSFLPSGIRLGSFHQLQCGVEPGGFLHCCDETSGSGLRRLLTTRAVLL